MYPDLTHQALNLLSSSCTALRGVYSVQCILYIEDDPSLGPVVQAVW